MITNLTKKQVEKIQFDEGIIILNYGETDERILAPTRGGGEFTANITVRDVEFDGKVGKTAGMQVIEEQAASIKTTTLSMSQDEFKLAFPGAQVEGTGDAAVIKNPKSGLISVDDYLKNVTMFGKLADGKYKRVTIYKAMHEEGTSFNAVPKGEGELEFEFHAHYGIDALDGDLWEVKEVENFNKPVVAKGDTTTTGTKVNLYFNKDIKTDSVNKAHYKVKDDGTPITITNVAVTGNKIELTLQSAVTKNKEITVDYTKPSTGGTASIEGFELDGFTGYAVENKKT